MKNWIDEAVFYQIYPLGFCNAPCFHEENITHSITKIIEWIPHLKKMNINALYLGPVFESHEHGYDTSDYRIIDHRLGDNDDMKALCKALHEAGIRVVLDGVFNHVGRDFWAFKDVKEKREHSSYCDWFENLRFDCDNPMNDGFTYNTWQGYYNLVKLNLRNEEVINYLLESIGMWIDEFDIDGLRLDAADVMDRDFFKRLKRYCKNRKSDFWLMGEIIHGNYNVWANDEMLDSVTNYECYKGLYSSHNDKNYFEIGHSLNRQFGKGGIYEHLKLYNFVDNHDVNRLASTVKCKEDLKNVYTMLYTMPGIPSLYYGSEWGIEGTKHDGSDADIRPCIALDEMKDSALTKHIAKLGELRIALEPLALGNYEQIVLKNEQFVYARTYQDAKVYVAFNVSDVMQTIRFEVNSATSLHDKLNNTYYPIINQSCEISLPAKSSAVMVLSNKMAVHSDKAPVQSEKEKAEETLIEQMKMKDTSNEDYLPLGRYEHYKGKHYVVLYIATHSETQEKYVVYRQLYGDEGVWVRPISMFKETVEIHGERKKRFTFIGK